MIVVDFVKRSVLGLSVAVLAMAGGAVPALALSPWWHLSSASRPTIIRSGVASNSVQEVTVTATGGFFYLAETLPIGSPNFSRVTRLPYNATPEEVRQHLESEVFPSRKVLVTGEPGKYTVTFPGQSLNMMTALTFQLTNGAGEGAVAITGRESGRPDGQIVLTVANVGDASVDGEATPVSIADEIPPGLSAVSIEGLVDGSTAVEAGAFGSAQCALASLTCTFAGKLPVFRPIEIRIGVEGGVSTGERNQASVSGGGAPSASLVRPLDAGDEPLFGVENYEITPEEEGGTLDTQAGSHPFQLTTMLAVNQTLERSSNASLEEPRPIGLAKDLHFRLPAGLIGNATQIPRCSLRQLSVNPQNGGEACPRQDAVGVAMLTLYDPHEAFSIATAPVFNLEPSANEPARFGFKVANVPVILDTSVRTGGDYGVTVNVSDIPQARELVSSQLTLWGVPYDQRHDSARGWECLIEEATEGSALAPCSPLYAAGRPPLLALPTSCTGPLQSSGEEDDWVSPGAFQPFALSTLMPAMDGCNRLPFNASLQVTPDTQAASTPSGLTVDLRFPQEETADGLEEGNLKKAVVTLPAGLVVNPSSADGLGACTPEEIGLNNANPVSCPDSAKVGTVEALAAALKTPLTGSVYVAQQANNPFGSLLALYIVAESEGVLVKLAGEVHLDPVTGQLTSTFDNIPQQPVSDIKLHFFGGSRAPLATPAACGTYTTTSQLTPYNTLTPVELSAAFQITSGPNGAGCGPLPFAPSLTGGTTNNQAGSFSAFTATFARADQDQNLSGVSVTTPPGLLGLLKGVRQCPEPQAGQGACGSDSLIGHTTVAAGAGPDPFYVQGGQVFLTGPYKGAPFGLSVVVPAVAGPFNLGNVVVRAAIHVDPHTAQITVTSDALPTILQGIPLDVRAVNVTIDRAGFMFNPTSCEPLSVGAALTSTQGATANVSSHFQAANCANLAFKPSFTVSTQAGTSKKNGASLDVKVAYPTGAEANLRSAAVTLPKQLPSRLSTIQQACPQATFAANPASCPAGSNIGIATAHTSVLANPVTGPAYLVSHGGAAFPDLVLLLQGEGVKLELIGSINIKKSITSSTFATIPDAPISSFELKLPEGPYSGLAAVLPPKAKGNLCGTSLTMPTTLTGQNGATFKQNTKIQVIGCAKAKKKKAKHKAKKHRKGKKK